jgi:probable phosphomutase (TIGR03848 family)
MPKTKQSSNTTVVLVRHGRTPTTGSVLPGRAAGLHLSDEGQSQAKNVAARIAAGFKNVSAVYASPLERTKETAAPIARELNTRIVVDKGLIELNCGDWAGRNLKDLAKLPEWKTVQQRPSAFRFPNGESFLEMQARIVGTIERLQAAHTGSTIIVVSHADPIKAAVASALGAPLDLFQRIVISPCSVSVVQYSPIGTSVPTINNTDALGSASS